MTVLFGCPNVVFCRPVPKAKQMPNQALLEFARTTLDDVVPPDSQMRSQRVHTLANLVGGFPRVKHSIKASKADEPLDDGTRVTDHLTALPVKLKLTGFVSDMDMGGNPGAAWEAILAINAANDLFKVTTEWAVYPEMAMTKCEADQTSRGCEFEMTLEKVHRVQVAQFTLPPQQVSGPAAQRTGSVDRGLVPLTKTGFFQDIAIEAALANPAAALNNP